MQVETRAERLSTTQSNTRVVGLLAAGHIVNDSYMNFFPPLLPVLTLALGLSLTQVGLITTFFSITSSISQLVIGRIADKGGGRFFIVLGPLLAAVAMSSIGHIDTFSLLLTVVSLAGLGIAAFHPPASALVGVSNREKSGRAMSIFSLGGNIGFAVMPLLVVPLVSSYGLGATPVMALPGIAMALLLFTYAPPVAPSPARASASFLRTVHAQLTPFLSLLGFVAFRSLTFFSLTTFLPLLLKERGFSLFASGIALSVLALSGAFGGLIGGTVSDSVGRKPVIIISLLATSPLLLLALASHGILTVVLLGFVGASLLASFSVAVVAAQEIFPDNRATASSLALGFGLGLGGLGVGLISFVADSLGLGIEQTVLMLCILPLVAAACALGLPGRRP